MPDRPLHARDINPARLRTDPLLAEIAALVGYMDLHLGRHQIKRLTTEQKELWADLVDADAVNTSLDPDGDYPPRRTVRWWRDHPRPINEEGHTHGETTACRSCGKIIVWDADIEGFRIPYETGNPAPDTFHCPWGERHYALPSGADEPDPFAYTDEGGTRVRGADQPVHVDEAAAGIARTVMLIVRDHTHPHWHTRHEDFAAVYEWAKQSVRPLRMTVGDRAGEVGALHSYPSLNAARAFLDLYRAERADRHSEEGPDD